MSVDRQQLGEYLGRDFDQGHFARVDLIIRLATDAVAGFLHVSTDQLAADPPPPADSVVIAVAARALENPLALTSESEGNWSGAFAAGAFSLTRGERRQLKPYQSASGADVSTTTLQSPHRQNVPWIGAGVGGNRIFQEQEGERVPWIANS